MIFKHRGADHGRVERGEEYAEHNANHYHNKLAVALHDLEEEE